MKNTRYNLLKRLASRLSAAMCLCVSLLLPSPLPAAELNDGVDRSDPNFVKASLLIMGPGDELFSCAGHACIRLECPTFKLDYCFSYESERVRDKLWTFFKGDLKMGLFAIPTQEFLKEYRDSGRGIRQYALDLPPENKQRLWRLLDEKAARGVDLPYDYIKRGCALSVLEVLLEALDNVDMSHVVWPARYQRPRREIIADAISGYPWTRFAIHAIVGTEGDRTKSNLEKIVVPADLLVFLRQARLGGKNIVVGEGVELLSASAKGSRGASMPLTPMVAACLLFVVSLVYFFCGFHCLDWLFLALQSVFGAFLTYMLVFSNLPATSWNWLVVPFNLLPLFFWKWRAKWALPYACVLVAWSMSMLATPHAYTDPAYAVLAFAYAVFFLKVAKLPGLIRGQRSSHDA